MKELWKEVSECNDFFEIEQDRNENGKLPYKLGLEDPTMKAFYDATNQQIEKRSEFLYFIMVKAMPISYWLPRLIIYYICYFTTELGSDAFELSFPFW